MHERDDDEDCETYQVGQNVPLKDRDVCLAVAMSMFPLLVVILKATGGGRVRDRHAGGTNGCRASDRPCSTRHHCH